MEKRYGRLKIVKDMGIMIKEGTKSKRHYFLCRCNCGKEKLVTKTDLISGKVQSCGCYFREKLIERNRKYNDYFLFNNVVFVKFSNVDRFFICDKEDLEIVKKYCWREDRHEYAHTKNKRKSLFFHRAIMNPSEKEEIDHIFPVKSGVCDNRRNNLRICSHQENMNNMSMYKNNTSGYHGVRYDKARNKWYVSISLKGRNKYLGRTETLDEAIQIRKEAEVKYRGKII